MYISQEARVSVTKTLWEEKAFSYLMVLYRAGSGEITQAPITLENGGFRVSIDEYPDINTCLFSHLEDLLQVLDEYGFTQVPGALDHIQYTGQKLPSTLDEQLSEPHMFLLCRRYAFQLQYESDSYGYHSAPVYFDGHSVYVEHIPQPEIYQVRFKTLDALLTAMNRYGEASILDWSYKVGVRQPAFE